MDLNTFFKLTDGTEIGFYFQDLGEISNEYFEDMVYENLNERFIFDNNDIYMFMRQEFVIDSLEHNPNFIAAYISNGSRYIKFDEFLESFRDYIDYN